VCRASYKAAYGAVKPHMSIGSRALAYTYRFPACTVCRQAGDLKNGVQQNESEWKRLWLFVLKLPICSIWTPLAILLYSLCNKRGIQLERLLWNEFCENMSLQPSAGPRCSITSTPKFATLHLSLDGVPLFSISPCLSRLAAESERGEISAVVLPLWQGDT